VCVSVVQVADLHEAHLLRLAPRLQQLHHHRRVALRRRYVQRVGPLTQLEQRVAAHTHTRIRIHTGVRRG
jgi:hypothetical protein